jgi:hypothetical protein
MIADVAFTVGMDMYYFSPFVYNAINAGVVYFGGKQDDITVVLGQVKLA